MINPLFYRILRIGLILCLLPFKLNADTEEEDTVLQFFSDMRTYIIKELGVQLSENFYTQKSEGYQHYLYVSDPEKVRLPEGEGNFRYFGSHVNKADSVQRQLIKKGYHTLLYRTAATSAAKVQSPLYNYPLHCLSFIALHESHHIHRRNQKGISIPYSLEEAAGDVLGNYVSLDFARTFPDKLDTTKVKEQILLNEMLYNEINQTRHRLDCGKNKRREFSRLTKYLQKNLKNSDSFKKDRFLYPVNNAYFIRYGYYTANYFILRDLYFKTGSAKMFLAYLDTLPSDEEAALSKINTYLKG